ncbi:MAG TPA: RagB/SusD family nutrient uptake outer membrane protein, partial [Cyclobacteriaceae bacterium]|nr:RagB/SusD family nutrient uptake outer membrane protein [Cyclobacteriaceae bacterium]
MKTISNFIVMAIVAFAIPSCDKFLEEKLVSDVSGAGYYTTAAGLDDAVDATYYYLKYVYSNERAYTLTVFGTDTYTNGSDGNFKGFNYYDNTLNSASDVNREMWQYLYRGINQANAVINRSQNVKDISPANLTLRLAEVRFLRALYYFNLVRQWGDVPLSLEETIGAQVAAVKSSQADVYEKGIVPDLEFAIANLPNTQSDYGRATKAAAEHLLGLALLTRGYQTYAKPDDFSRAETYFGNVINNYGFSLTSDMGKLWDQDNQRNKEIIFAVQNSTNALLNGGPDAPPGEGNRGHLFFLMEYDIQPGMIRDIANGRPFKRFRPTPYLLNLWGANRDNDDRFDQTYKQAWISNNPLSIPKWTQANVDAGAKNKDGSPAVVGQ